MTCNTTREKKNLQYYVIGCSLQNFRTARDSSMHLKGML
jgi:hypothetical protein